MHLKSVHNALRLEFVFRLWVWSTRRAQFCREGSLVRAAPPLPPLPLFPSLNSSNSDQVQPSVVVPLCNKCCHATRILFAGI